MPTTRMPFERTQRAVYLKPRRKEPINLTAWQTGVIRKLKHPDFRPSSVCDTHCAHRMIEHAGITNKSAVLDPFGGFGFSGLLVSLARPKKLVLNDLLYRKEKMPQNVEEAWREKHGAVPRTGFEFTSYDAARTGFRSGSFDSIVTSPPYNLRIGDTKAQYAVFERCLPELFRVLKPGGKMVLRVPAYWLGKKIDNGPGMIPQFHGFRYVNHEVLPQKRDFRNAIIVYEKPRKKR